MADALFSDDVKDTVQQGQRCDFKKRTNRLFRSQTFPFIPPVFSHVKPDHPDLHDRRRSDGRVNEFLLYIWMLITSYSKYK